MSTAFFEATKPYIMPGGGVLGTGEIAGLDPTNAANMAAIASGTLVSSGAPPAYVAPVMTRVQFTGKTGPVMVNNSPPLYQAAEIATFPAAVAAALIAQGLAVAN
jgi:hypothetical protein